VAPGAAGRLALVPANVTATVVLLVVLAVWLALEIVLSRRSAAAEQSGPWWMEWAMGIATTAVVGGGIVISGAFPAGTIYPQSFAYALGILLLCLGLLLRACAAATLGPFYTLTLVVRRDHRVCDRGVYRILRHPGYAGTLVAFIGLMLALGNWIAVSAVLALVPPLVCRIVIEERLLRNALGAAYDDYCRRTRWRLLPGVL
jgi:protein-S-isoprenylcysteine O-methyltransferase Ste14